MQRYFLPLVFVMCTIGLMKPELFSWGKGYIPYLLGLIMFGMGATLSGKDFVDVLKNWKAITVGVIAHYTVMPAIALGLALLFQLPPDLFAGVILVGSCPAGTASNVMSYIGKGNVALSVTMTLISTSISPIATPAIFYLLAQKVIHINVSGMVSEIFWIIIFPLVDGLIIRRLFQEQVKKITPFLPSFSLLVLAFLITVIISVNQKTLMEFQYIVILAVIIHNLAGFFVGYNIGRFFKLAEADRRSVSIEIGMQNSGLGASLALTFLSAQAALPCAIFSLWQNISGSMLAKYWANKDENIYNFSLKTS